MCKIVQGEIDVEVTLLFKNPLHLTLIITITVFFLFEEEAN